MTDITQKTLDDVKAGIPARDAEIEALRKQIETLQAQLQSPVNVHSNMCRGIIAPITFDMLAHVLGDDAKQEWIAAQAQQPVSGADLHRDEEIKALDEAWKNGICHAVGEYTAAKIAWLRRAALAQQDAYKVDAERYRWLRDTKNDVALVLDKRTGYVPEDEQIPGVGGYHTYEYRAGVDLDDAIDAARKEQGQ